MDALKTIYNVYVEEEEIEGMFDEKGNLLGTWTLNDANWRDEYFGGFMEALGIHVVYSDRPDFKQKLRAAWASQF